ncbi:MAG: hypothetical protein ACI4LE_00265, partial [Faecalibacterium sp.]
HSFRRRFAMPSPSLRAALVQSEISALFLLFYCIAIKRKNLPLLGAAPARGSAQTLADFRLYKIFGLRAGAGRLKSFSVPFFKKEQIPRFC